MAKRPMTRARKAILAASLVLSIIDGSYTYYERRNGLR